MFMELLRAIFFYILYEIVWNHTYLQETTMLTKDNQLKFMRLFY